MTKAQSALEYLLLLGAAVIAIIAIAFFIGGLGQGAARQSNENLARNLCLDKHAQPASACEGNTPGPYSSGGGDDVSVGDGAYNVKCTCTVQSEKCAAESCRYG